MPRHILAKTCSQCVRLREANAELLAFAKAFVALFCDSDMRPEDECHELYNQALAAIAEATKEAP